jgi:hypothetical protein
MNATTGQLAAKVWDQAHVVVEATELADQLGTESAEITRAVAMADMNRALDAMSIGDVQSFDDIRALAWFANWQMTTALTSIEPDIIRNAVMRSQIAVRRLAEEMNAADLKPPSTEPIA